MPRNEKWREISEGHCACALFPNDNMDGERERAEFENLLQNLMSPENDSRTQAEVSSLKLGSKHESKNWVGSMRIL